MGRLRRYLIQRLPWRVVHRGAEQRVLVDIGGERQQRVAAGDEEHEEGELRRRVAAQLRQPRRERVRLHVVDRDHGQLVLQTQVLGVVRAYPQRTLVEVTRLQILC